MAASSVGLSHSILERTRKITRYLVLTECKYSCDFSPMEFDFYKAQFTKSEAVTLTGVSTGTLANWLQRPIGKGGIAVAPEHKGGTGYRRLFSCFDMVKIATARELVELNVPPTMANEIISSDKFAEWVALTLADRDSHEESAVRRAILYKRNGQYLVDFIAHVATRDRWERDNEDLRSSVKASINIELGEIVADIRDRVAMIVMSEAAPNELSDGDRVVLAMRRAVEQETGK